MHLNSLPWAAATYRVFIPVLVISVFSLIGFFARLEGQRLRKKGIRIVAYSTAFKVTVIVLATFMGIGAFMCLLSKATTGVAVLGGMAAACGLLLLECYRFRIVWDDHFLYVQSAWRKPRQIPLAAIEGLEEGSWGNNSHIHTRFDGKISVPSMAMNTDLLAETIGVTD